mmetsp:Transcript_40946/g.96268  ORF Transcript_40946/g.96268 Transcript_40946/m.96268 type:complete len:222 (-) Transcript_40946:1111-1776(-)
MGKSSWASARQARPRTPPSATRVPRARSAKTASLPLAVLPVPRERCLAASVQRGHPWTQRRAANAAQASSVRTASRRRARPSVRARFRRCAASARRGRLRTRLSVCPPAPHRQRRSSGGRSARRPRTQSRRRVRRTVSRCYGSRVGALASSKAPCRCRCRPRPGRCSSTSAGRRTMLGSRRARRGFRRRMWERPERTRSKSASTGRSRRCRRATDTRGRCK